MHNAGVFLCNNRARTHLLSLDSMTKIIINMHVDSNAPKMPFGSGRHLLYTYTAIDELIHPLSITHNSCAATARPEHD